MIPVFWHLFVQLSLIIIKVTVITILIEMDSHAYTLVVVSKFLFLVANCSSIQALLTYLQF